jgi:peptidyl-prolyl cis-trans isomerase SurA
MSFRGSRVLTASLLAIASSCLGLIPARAQLAQAPADNLNLRYANGIVAIAEDHIVTVDDVRREIGPLVPEIQKQSRNERSSTKSSRRCRRMWCKTSSIASSS